jgi:hypothetical protein
MSLIAARCHRLSVRSCVLMVCGLVYLWLSLPVVSSYAQGTDLTATLETSPAAGEIRPDLDYVKVTLKVWLNGQPLSAGHLQVTVTAPPKPSLLSTDFPIVEGTSLFTLASDLRAGTWTFDYLFPIRGTYSFDLKVSPVSGGPAFPVTTLHKTLHLPENPAEVRNIWLLVVGLFLLGGVGGVMFARSAAAREGLHAVAVLAVVVLGGLLLPGHVGVSQAAEHGPGAHGSTSHGSDIHTVEGEAGWTLAVQATPSQGTVGKLVRFDIDLRQQGATPSEADGAEIRLVMHHVEDDKAMFETTVYTRQGHATEQFQFFDGAPHVVTVTAQPGGAVAVQPLQVRFDMEVEGIHPPTAIKVRTIALLIGVMVVGMVAGFFLPSRREG